MSRNSEIILPNNTHLGDSAVKVVTGEKFKADGYYSKADGFHTVQYNLSDFVGSVHVQATLASDPIESDWFTIPQTNHISSSVDDSNSSGSFIYNFSGNYVWIRAVMSDWIGGSLKSVLFNH